MPLATLKEYLREKNYQIWRDNHQNSLNLKELNVHHDYHLYVRYRNGDSTFSISVYYEGQNFLQNFQNAQAHINRVIHGIHDDPRWANICQTLHQEHDWFGEMNMTHAHGDWKFRFANPNNNVLPTTEQLRVIENLIRVLFANF